MRLEPIISILSGVSYVHRANWDNDGQRIRKCIILKPKAFRNVQKSRISITELYELIRHMHECQVNIVKSNTLYLGDVSPAKIKGTFSLKDLMLICNKIINVEVRER